MNGVYMGLEVLIFKSHCGAVVKVASELMAGWKLQVQILVVADF